MSVRGRRCAGWRRVQQGSGGTWGDARGRGRRRGALRQRSGGCETSAQEQRVLVYRARSGRCAPQRRVGWSFCLLAAPWTTTATTTAQFVSFCSGNEGWLRALIMRLRRLCILKRMKSAIPAHIFAIQTLIFETGLLSEGDGLEAGCRSYRVGCWAPSLPLGSLSALTSFTKRLFLPPAFLFRALGSRVLAVDATRRDLLTNGHH